MYPIKTREEWYEEYLAEIEAIEHSIQVNKRNIEKEKRAISRAEERIEGLKEMLEIYAPKQGGNENG